MVRRGLLRTVTSLVVLTSVVAAAGAHADTGSPGSAPPTSQPTVGEWTVDELVVELAAAGVEVFAEPGSGAPIVAATQPVSPMRLLRDHVASLLGSAGVPVGLLDAEIGAISTDDGIGADAVAATSLTPSAMIVAWADDAGTPAAALARRLLDTANPESVDLAVVPELVLILFAADVATVGASLPVPPADSGPAGFSAGSSRHVATPAIPPGPCSAAIDFVNHVTATVFDAIGRLRNPPPVNTGFGLFDDIVDGLATIVVGGVNIVLDGAELVIDSAVRVAIGTVVSYVGRVASVAGTAAMIANAVRPWALRLTPEPRHVEAPNGGVVHARIDLGGLDEWPAWAVNCAEVADVTLPPLRPEGNPITWSVSPADQALISPGQFDRALRQGGVADYPFVATAAPPQPGQPTVIGSVRVRAVVQRDDLTKLGDEIQALLQRELANLVPPVGELIAPHLVPLVRPWIDRALGVVEHLRDVRWMTWIEVEYADPNPPTTTQPPPPATVVSVTPWCPPPDVVTATVGYPVPDHYSGGPRGEIELECSYGLEDLQVHPAAGIYFFVPGSSLPPEVGCAGYPTTEATVAGASLAYLCSAPVGDLAFGSLVVHVGDRAIVVTSQTEAGAIGLAKVVIAGGEHP